jgi:hypothetical protein
MSKKSIMADIPDFGYDEQGFNIPLQTLIKGKNASGKDFDERTVLSYISHNGSSFWMANPVTVGNELKLIIDLPPKLSEDKTLKLIIRGRVVFVEAPKNKDHRHRVSLKFENKYMIDDDDPKLS